MNAGTILELHKRAEAAIKQLPLADLVKNYEGSKKLLNRQNLPAVTEESITPATAEAMIRTIGGAVNLYNIEKLTNYVNYLEATVKKAEAQETSDPNLYDVPSENPIYEELYNQASKEAEYWKIEYHKLVEQHRAVISQGVSDSNSKFVRSEIEMGDL